MIKRLPEGTENKASNGPIRGLCRRLKQIAGCRGRLQKNEKTGGK